MTEVFLGIGSNLGDSLKMVQKAIEKISKLGGVRNFKKSPFYITAPISDISQADYVNLVCSFEIDCSDPLLLLNLLQVIEQDLGKVPKPKNAPRLIDIDILLYGDLYIEQDDLEIPHPRMLERLFVLEPLLNLKKEILYPLSKKEVIKISLEKLILKIKGLGKQVVKKIH